MKPVIVYSGEEIADYGFGQQHPFSNQRHDAFVRQLKLSSLDKQVEHGKPVRATVEEIALFHDVEYIEKVKQLSETGVGYLDGGDTPARKNIYRAACYVAGTALRAAEQLVRREHNKAFIPIAGLHHARRAHAAGFCVFNDCGVVIEALRKKHAIQRIAYVDIDAHHGDGVFYSFEDDADLCFVDFHEDGRYLYPGTGRVEETGIAQAKGTKLNIPMPMRAGDELFRKLWPEAEQFIEKTRPEFIILQCGADSIMGDPLTHLHYTADIHRWVAGRLCDVAEKHSQGRLLAMGGGGYNLQNLAVAWCAVVEALVEHSAGKQG